MNSPPQLYNSGGSCYLNSGFQALASCNNYISEIQKLCQKFGTLPNLNLLMKLLLSLVDNQQSLYHIKQGEIFNNWTKVGQQDTFDLLSHVINLVYDEIRRNNPNLRDLDEWLKYPLPMQVRFHQTITCESGHKAPCRDELGLALHVPLFDRCNDVSELLDCFFSSRSIEDYTCSDCESTTKGKIQTCLQLPLPTTLCIHLQRLMNGRKVDRHVGFSPQLQTKSTWMDAGINPDIYTLCAVIVHMGSHLAGHYVCFRLLDKRWFYTNDTYVHEVPFSKVESAHAYVLFYEIRPESPNTGRREGLQTMPLTTSHSEPMDVDNQPAPEAVKGDSLSAGRSTGAELKSLPHIYAAASSPDSQKPISQEECSKILENCKSALQSSSIKFDCRKPNLLTTQSVVNQYNDVLEHLLEGYFSEEKHNYQELLKLTRQSTSLQASQSVGCVLRIIDTTDSSVHAIFRGLLHQCPTTKYLLCHLPSLVVLINNDFDRLASDNIQLSDSRFYKRVFVMDTKKHSWMSSTNTEHSSRNNVFLYRLVDIKPQILPQSQRLQNKDHSNVVLCMFALSTSYEFIEMCSRMLPGNPQVCSSIVHCLQGLRTDMTVPTKILDSIVRASGIGVNNLTTTLNNLLILVGMKIQIKITIECKCKNIQDMEETRLLIPISFSDRTLHETVQCRLEAAFKTQPLDEFDCKCRSPSQGQRREYIHGAPSILILQTNDIESAFITFDSSICLKKEFGAGIDRDYIYSLKSILCEGRTYLSVHREYRRVCIKNYYVYCDKMPMNDFLYPLYLIYERDL